MRASRLLVLLSLSLALPACTRDRTEIVIGVATDLYAKDLIDRAHLSVSRDGVEVIKYDWDLSGVPAEPFELPGSFGVYTEDGSAPRIDVVAAGFLGDRQLIDRRSVLSLVTQKTLFMRMALVQRCTDADCPEGATCVEGECRTSRVDRRKLPTYRPGMEFEVECDSGTLFVNTSTREPMTSTGTTCPSGEVCVEGTCYKSDSAVVEEPDASSPEDGGIEEDLLETDARLPADLRRTDARPSDLRRSDATTSDGAVPVDFAPLDGSLPGDGAQVSEDLATTPPDLTGSTDGAVSVDLKPAADLKPVPDLKPPADLVSPPDLVVPPVPKKLSFLVAPSYAAGVDPSSIAAADLNGDATVDLVTANSASGTVSVFLGAGLGVYKAAVSYTAGKSPSAVAIGDLNRDGKLDLAVTNLAGSDVSVLLGTGTGTFGAATSVPTSASPTALALGDVDGTGSLDLVMLCGSTATYLLGNGNGTFGKPISLGTGFTAVRFADVNGDGRPDVVAAGPGAAAPLFGAYIGTGTNRPFSAFRPSSVANTARALVVGDFTGDKLADVVILNAGTNGALMIGAGDGSFKSGGAVATGGLAGDGAALDVDQDGKADLLLANPASGQMMTGAVASLAVHLSTGTGFKAADLYAGGPSPIALAVAYLNGDKLRDIAVASLSPTGGAGTVNLLLATSGSRFAAASKIATPAIPPSTVLAADLTGDGNLDLLGAGPGSAAGGGSVSVWAGLGAGLFSSTPVTTRGSSPMSAALGDANGDKVLDLLVANRFDNTLGVLPGKGGGVFSVPFTVSAGKAPFSVLAADVNGDGNLDAVVANSGDNATSPPDPGTVYLYLGTGTGNFMKPSSLAVGKYPVAMALGELNGDKRADLVVANRDDNTITVLLGNGSGFTAYRTVATAAGPSALMLGDFNRDGKLDVAATTGSTQAARGAVSVLLGNGAGGLATAVNYPVGLVPWGGAVGDLDLDGVLDLISADEAGRAVSVLLGNGNGTFKSAVAFSTASRPRSVVAGDFNRDGLTDLATASLAEGNLSLLLNTSQ